MIDLGDLSRDPWSLLPGPGRLSRRGADTRRFDTLTYARIGGRSRRHHALRPQAPPQHRALCLGAEARAPRPLLQRRRPRRLRHPRLRHRRRDLARAPVDRRDARRCASEGAGRVARRAYAPAGRLAGRPVDRQRPVRPAVRHPRARTRTRSSINLPTTLPQRQRADADHRLCRPRSSRRRPIAKRSAPDGQVRVALPEDSADAAAGAESICTAAARFWYPQAPVSDYATATMRITVPAALRMRGQRHARRRTRPRLIAGQGAGAIRQAVRLQRDAAGPLSRVHRQPVRARGDRHDRASIARTRPTATVCRQCSGRS